MRSWTMLAIWRERASRDPNKPRGSPQRGRKPARGNASSDYPRPASSLPLTRASATENARAMPATSRRPQCAEIFNLFGSDILEATEFSNFRGRGCSLRAASTMILGP